MAAIEIRTLANLPFYFSGRYPKPALVGHCTQDGVSSFSSREFFEKIRDFSLGLTGVNVDPGDRVALLCETRPEWVVADLAALAAGCITVPIYPTLPADRIRYILADAGVNTVIVSNQEQAQKVHSILSQLSELRRMIVIDAQNMGAGSNSVPVDQFSFSEIEEIGHRRLMQEDGLARDFKETAASVPDDQLATIIYTSGTTGDPKGVMLTHGAIVANIVDGDTMITLTDADEALSFLPLCHALERQVVYLYLYKGVSITFAESMDTVARDLLRVRPTLMTGVPRFFEKLHARVLEGVSKASTTKRRLFKWALGVGLGRTRAEFQSQQPTLVLRLQNIVADRLVFSKIRERTGGRLRFVVSGGAPLSVAVGEFFFAIGVPVLEGYGLTETAPVLTVNSEHQPRLGTVGKALPRVELQIAADGEILARGPNLMLGYYKKAEATAEVMRDGWFHTGDIGQLDEDGYLRITDRKKELLVTSSGKNIAPQPIEQRLKQSPLVSEAVLLGDRRPFVSALIVPDLVEVEARLSAEHDSGVAVSLESQHVRPLFEMVVQRVNAELPSYEQIKKFVLLDAEFSIASGELTPTLKIRRRVVLERYAETIDSLYSSSIR